MVILIIAEKKSAALQLANALDYSGKPREFKINSGVSYIEIQLFGTREKAFIASAAGHLYKLETKGKRGALPVFDFHWVQNKQNKYIYKYVRTIKDIISKNHVSEYVIATDLDLEGSVIGFNIVKFACLKGTNSVKRVRDNSSRMEFSTLTKQEIRKAWQGRKKGLDCNRIKAGYARHWVDILFGINLSKALTDAVKSVSGRFQIFSMGRVQGPTLKAVYERDEKIENHVPKKYWELDVIGKTTSKTISLAHIPTRFSKKDDANKIKDACSGQMGHVKEITGRDKRENPPTPFNLGSLQREASRIFKFKPSKTLKIAEKLYLNALISYPRTESEIIPPEIDIKGIMGQISRFPKPFADHAKNILQGGHLIPSKGKKKDKAHPPIMPTGKLPPVNGLRKDENLIFELVVYRFLSLFGSALRWKEHRYTILVKEHEFTCHGARLVDPGWTTWYPYGKKGQAFVDPGLKQGQQITIQEITVLEKFTKPPPHYSDITLLNYMERKDIGTKSTRAAIIDKLKTRNYIERGQIKITELGKAIISLFNTFLPDIISVELTRDLESSLEKIVDGGLEPEQVIERTKNVLLTNLNDFLKSRDQIGKQLATLVKDQKRKVHALGSCPKCKKHELVLVTLRNKKRFVSCNGRNSKSCDVTLPITQKGRIYNTGKTCPHCGYPMVKRVSRGKSPWIFCVNWSKCPGNAGRKTSGDNK